MDRTYPATRLPTRSRIALALATAFAAQAVLAAPPAPTALPTGGSVIAGQASIQQTGAAMTINQTTGQAILNWQSFNIGASASVNFVQPGASSVALNRVLGSDPSAIYGSLTANGQVFLVNPSGVLFGPGARVDVGGLVASTLNIRDADFLARNYRFTRDGASGTVVNQGELMGQYVALLAPEVRNEGVIAARMGTIALAAGDAVTLGISGQRLVDVQVDKASIDTLVENRQLVRAEEGTVILSAQSAHTLLGRVVNSGAIEANGISTDGGVVRLLASSSVEHSGSISADGAVNGSGGSAILLADLSNPASVTRVSGSISTRGGSAGGDGGFIETSAHRLSIADTVRIDASAPNGRSGQWLLDPIDLTIAPNGDISGTTISAALNGGSNVTLTTDATSALCNGVACVGTASAGTNGDIHVNQEVSWTTAQTLTLSAFRDVNINSPITSSNATGKLALEYNQGDGGGTYRVFAPVTLAAGNNFSTKDGSGGATDTYSVLTSKAGLVGIVGDLTAKYALGADIDASGADWAPLGTGDNTGAGFSGVLEGFRHAVTKLTTSTAANNYVGLFGTVDANGKVRNLGVETDAAGITGTQFVGVVAGKNFGAISQTYSKGLITGAGAGTVLGIGGLVGWNEGTITETYSAAKVDAAGGTQSTGTGTDGGIGGLVGVNSGAGQIFASYATGQVDGGIDVGGLVGYQAGGSIQSVYSTGAVSGTNSGGLIGTSQTGQIINGSWDMDTSGTATGIGLDLFPPFPPPPPPPQGYATADMKLQANFGGYDFNNYSLTAAPPGNWVMYETFTYPLLRPFLTPLFVYADNKTAPYNGAAAAGVAFTKTYSVAAAGGLAGAVTFGGTAAAGVNAAAYGITPNVVEPTSYGGAGVSGLAPNDKTDQAGYILIPVAGNLTITPKAVNLTAPAATKPYDGATTYTPTAGELAALSALLGVGGETITGITLTYTGAAAGAGNKTLTPSAATVSSAAGNYNITYTPIATASITPKAVNLTPQAATKVFDGTTNYTATAGDLAVLSALLGVGGETVTGVTLTYNTAAVGIGKTLTPSAATVSSAAGNYNITYTANATSVITAVPVPPAPVVTTTPLVPATNPADSVVRLFDGGSGNATSVLAGAGTAVGLRVFDSAAFSLASDLITPEEGGGDAEEDRGDRRPAKAALLKGAVVGKGSLIPPGGLVVMSSAMSQGNGYTQNGTGLYQTRVELGGPNSAASLSADKPVPSVDAASGTNINYKLPDDAFVHNKPDASVTLSASQDGKPLPDWLHFDAATGTFSGTPPAGFTGPLNIKVTARDNTGHSADSDVTFDGGAAASARAKMRGVAAGTGAERARAEIRPTAAGGSRVNSIGTGRIGGALPGGGRLGTTTQGTGGRLGTSTRPGGN